MPQPFRLVWRIDWRRGPRELRQAIDKARLEALGSLEREVRKNAPTQGLKDAVKRTAAQVVVDHPAAAIVEFGARPHFPPPGALIPWMLSVGKDPNDEYAVARAISQRGFQERPYFRPAIEAIVQEIPAQFGKIWGK